MPYQLQTFTYDNPMRKPRLEKVVVNIGVGEGGEKLIKAEKVLQMVTGRKPLRTLSRVNNREWGL
ncbi:MAG TPA: 50S ribosomal protein L5, partial [Candidatus Thermoplasmatota archaeon]|nr:50S ribosomal protein L5 [Candidatus Thermoplasmatota archaeon]